jgi:hypothetical protein
MAPLLTIKHDNNTGRWVLPFRACWNAASDGVIVGAFWRGGGSRASCWLAAAACCRRLLVDLQAGAQMPHCENKFLIQPDRASRGSSRGSSSSSSSSFRLLS